MNRSALLTAAFVTAALVLTGCESEEKLFTVTGTVSYDGKPVPKGVIHFDPDGAKGAKGTAGYADILDGKFTTGVSGKGVRGGPYSIRINAFDGKVGPEAPFGSGLCPEHVEARDLPQSNTELKIEIKKAK